MKAIKNLNTFIFLAFWLLTTPLSAQGTFTEVHNISCGDTMYISPLGYPTWNDPSIIDYPQSGFAQLLGDFVAANILEYQAPSFISTTDTVVIPCAHATQITCDTGIYVFKVTCAVDSMAYDEVITIPVACNDSIYSASLSGWGLPQLTELPTHGTAKIIMQPNDGAGVLYVPQPGFVGLDYATVSMFQGQTTILYIFQVQCGILHTYAGESALPLCIYPNPASGSSSATLDIPSGGVLSVFTVDGRLLPIGYTVADEHSIKVTGLASLPRGVLVFSYRLGKSVYVAEYLNQ